MSASEARIHEGAESISKTHDKLLREQAQNEALNRPIEWLSVRYIQPRPIGIDPPKFDGTAACTIVTLALGRGEMWCDAAYRGRYQNGIVRYVSFAG